MNPNPEYGRPGQTLAMADVDNDGDIDLFIGNSRTDITNPEAETSDIMLNDGSGYFEPGPAENDARFENRPGNPSSASFTDFNRD